MPVGDAAMLDELKRAAAFRAVESVDNGMVVGLGSGSTAAFAIEALAARIATGLSVLGIPTSEASANLARRLGVPLTAFDIHRRIDITIDGADEAEPHSFHLIKGRGGALLREKIVAAASDRMIVVVDETKIVNRLGAGGFLPVEVVPFGWQATFARLAAVGCRPRLRTADGQPFLTDGGHFIADCGVAEIEDVVVLEAKLAHIPGVVDTGLFLGLASMLVVGRKSGVEVLER
jgi:ribose 5-phosphate isomerase A